VSGYDTSKIKYDEDGGLTCSICYMGYDDGFPFPLTACGCIFHKECLEDYVDNALTEMNLKMVCPQDGCGKEII
jgi:hypothetical protein